MGLFVLRSIRWVSFVLIKVLAYYLMSLLKQSSPEIVIKLRHHCQGKPKIKKVSLKSSDYLLLCDKIAQSLSLDINKMYSMSYLDNTKQPILVSNQEDLDIMITASVSLTLEIEETDIPEHNFMQAIVELKEEEAVLRKEAQLREIEEYKQEIKAELETQIKNTLKAEFMKVIAAREQTIELKDQIIAKQSKLLEEKEKMIGDLNRRVQNFHQKLAQTKKEALQKLRLDKQEIQAKAEELITSKIQDYLSGKQREQSKVLQELRLYKQKEAKAEKQVASRKQSFMSRKQQQQSNFRNIGVVCQGKNCSNHGDIMGVRFQCLSCTDFNFCLKCKDRQRHIESHIFHKISMGIQEEPNKHNNHSERTKVQNNSNVPAKREVKHEQKTKEEGSTMQKINKLKQLGISQQEIKKLMERHPNQSVQFLIERYYQYEP